MAAGAPIEHSQLAVIPDQPPKPGHRQIYGELLK